MGDHNFVSDIGKLKMQRDALILAHNYQLPEVQAVADYVGDSLSLCKMAVDSDKSVIVFCGVRFMAETAKLLNPQKTVLLPAQDANCPMADMVDAQTLKSFTEEHSDAMVVCYINSSIEVKAESHICCTSSNAVHIVGSQNSDKIVFVPDRNLAEYVEEHVTTKKLIKMEGYCPVHESLTIEDISMKRARHSGAQVLVHPECTSEVRGVADFVGGTENIIRYVIESEEKTFLIGTECGILYRLKNSCPDKEFHMLSDTLVCPDMKKITLKDIYNSLLWNQYSIEIDEDIYRRAANALHGMLDLTV